MKTYEFFLLHSVFRVEEFTAFLATKGSTNPATRQSLLSYHTRAGRIFRIRRGVYGSLMPGASPDSTQIDPFLLACRITVDAVVAYQSALQFYNLSPMPQKQLIYLTSRSLSRSFRFQDLTYRGTSHPEALKRKGMQETGVVSVEHGGTIARVTSIERSLVDVLDRPIFSTGWTDLWKILERIQELDVQATVDYALALDKATTIAKVGLFLERNRAQLAVEEEPLMRLRQRIPRSPHYMARPYGRSGRLVSGWNLIVPLEILDRKPAQGSPPASRDEE